MIPNKDLFFRAYLRNIGKLDILHETIKEYKERNHIRKDRLQAIKAARIKQGEINGI